MRFFVAILVAILVHLVLFINFEKEKIKDSPKKVKKSQINLSNFKLKKETPKVKKVEKIEKKLEVKKEIIKEKKTVKKIETKIKKSEENLSLIVLNALQNKKVEKNSKKEENLMGFLKTSTASKNQVKLENQPLKELYEDEFEYLSKDEKEFLEDNLAKIGYITQKYLEYPEVAGMTGQEGVNVVEFYLFPNGDINSLKIIKGSNYTMLDKNSIKTIEYAYKEYPRPKQKTKVRIYTHYHIIKY